MNLNGRYKCDAERGSALEGRKLVPLVGNGSIVDSTGAIRHFGRKAFVQLASDFDRCFVCGSSNASRSFNDEHVIPDWILQRFRLHSRRITLPNGRGVMYGRYTLRCCVECNSLLGKKIETPISKVLSGTVEQVSNNLQSKGWSLLYKWLCLLFIKSHLKDRDIRIVPDTRVESAMLGEIYDWDGLHHIHTVARVPDSGASIDEGVLGTMLIFPMQGRGEPFDFGDLSEYSRISVRLGPIGIAAVLNDCGVVARLVAEYLSRITGPLSSIQLREVAARLAYGNTLLANRSLFWTEVEGGSLIIRSHRGDPLPLRSVDRVELGKVLAGACGPLLRQSRTPGVDQKMQQLAQGEIQFLYRDNGSFIDD